MTIRANPSFEQLLTSPQTWKRELAKFCLEINQNDQPPFHQLKIHYEFPQFLQLDYRFFTHFWHTRRILIEYCPEDDYFEIRTEKNLIKPAMNISELLRFLRALLAC